MCLAYGFKIPTKRLQHPLLHVIPNCLSSHFLSVLCCVLSNEGKKYYPKNVMEQKKRHMLFLKINESF